MLNPFYQDQLLEAGCDEAGRGCFAGPVFASAVILPRDFFHPLLNDSKQLTEEERNEVRVVIEKEAVSFAVASISHREIDRINILQASVKAMHISVSRLAIKPGLLLIDGNYFRKYKRIPHQCIVKGDATFSSIAAASILAKTYRDEYMKKLHDEFPHYNWASNKGYGTPEHRRALDEYGMCKYHRKSWRLFQEVQAELFDN
ncbi:MAG TPA: ribonuclease HII [Chitinophagaceae bacterium]|nr:ribonuclease HII [Chitinophagaceae bacterium]